jgi:2-C-methyl-D-erythritol 4-phosphate cytidylyltransferase
VDLVGRIEMLFAESQVEVVPGGSTRQDSVGAALVRVDRARVVVHDAARPFVTPDLIASVLEALEGADASFAAVRVDETLKRRNEETVTTIDRTDLWRAQTPQAFRTQVLKRAHAEARRAGFVGTDDAQLVERVGGSVALVEGNTHNLKLTVPEDFALAEAMAALRS